MDRSLMAIVMWGINDVDQRRSGSRTFSRFLLEPFTGATKDLIAEETVHFSDQIHRIN